MPVKIEIIRAALQGQNILPRLESEAREAVEATLTAALLYPRAQAYADHLERVELPEAEATLADCRNVLAQTSAAFGQASPTMETSAMTKIIDAQDEQKQAELRRFGELRRAVDAAERASSAAGNRVRIVKQQIDALRSTPRPDCVVLERLGLGVNVPCPDEGR